jgi:3-hydroxyisobutyrate dehydrogenase-like beta-hydroxyacid dehydrogenase
MMFDYNDMVNNINKAYWRHLLENDTLALAEAARIAEEHGLQPEAAQEIVRQYSRGPLEEWLTLHS